MDEVVLPLGLTPPPGRLGHSLPTPRLLGKGPIFVSHYRASKNIYKVFILYFCNTMLCSIICTGVIDR